MNSPLSPIYFLSLTHPTVATGLSPWHTVIIDKLHVIKHNRYEIIDVFALLYHKTKTNTVCLARLIQQQNRKSIRKTNVLSSIAWITSGWPSPEAILRITSDKWLGFVAINKDKDLLSVVDVNFPLNFTSFPFPWPIYLIRLCLPSCLLVQRLQMIH